MDINIVDVILYAILALSVISGMYKGFITSGLAMVGFGAAWYGALNLFPWLAQLALKNEAFMGMLGYYLDPSSLFKTNVGNQLFKDIPNVSTVADYLGHTIWVSAINVLAFILIFVVCYVVVLLVVNLLNNVFRFPLLKHLDWLLGGLFGLARVVIVVMLLLDVAPLILSMLPFKEVQSLLEASTLAQRLTSNFAVSTIISMAFQPIAAG